MALICTEFSTFNCDSRRSVGGIGRVRIINRSYVDTVLYDNNERVTSISLFNNALWYRLDDVAQMAIFTETISRDAKGLLWGQELKLGVVKRDYQKRLVIQSLSNRNLAVIYTDRNNKHWLLGYPNALKLTTASSSTGNYNGFNGYDFSLTTQSVIQAREVLQSVIDDIDDTTLACPNEITINSTLLELYNCFLNDYINDDLN